MKLIVQLNFQVFLQCCFGHDIWSWLQLNNPGCFALAKQTQPWTLSQGKLLGWMSD